MMILELEGGYVRASGGMIEKQESRGRGASDLNAPSVFSARLRRIDDSFPSSRSILTIAHHRCQRPSRWHRRRLRRRCSDPVSHWLERSFSLLAFARHSNSRDTNRPKPMAKHPLPRSFLVHKRRLVWQPCSMGDNRVSHQIESSLHQMPSIPLDRPTSTSCCSSKTSSEDRSDLWSKSTFSSPMPLRLH